jgi:retinol dehydrogenase-12
VVLAKRPSRCVVCRSEECRLISASDKALLYKKAKVYIASHSETRVKATIQELKELTGQEALFIELELSSLSSVRAAAQQFQQFVPASLSRLSRNKYSNCRQESKLHVLFNNAYVPQSFIWHYYHSLNFRVSGVMLPDPKAFTAEGHDLQFGVNVLGA